MPALQYLIVAESQGPKRNKNVIKRYKTYYSTTYYIVGKISNHNRLQIAVCNLVFVANTGMVEK